jgi:hypothetical protein
MLKSYIFPMTYNYSIVLHIMYDVRSSLSLNIFCKYVWISNDILKGEGTTHAHLFWFYSYLIIKILNLYLSSYTFFVYETLTLKLEIVFNVIYIC